MTASIFPYSFLRKTLRERLAFSNAVSEQGGGRRVVQKLHAAGELVVAGDLLFPNHGGSWDSFEALWEDRFGGFSAFLYKRQNKARMTSADALVAVAAQVDFIAVRRYVDVATLVVKKNTVTQTLGVHYTLQNEAGGAYVLGTSTMLVVHFAGAPGAAAAIALSYEFYYPMRFEGDDLLADQDVIGGGLGGATIADRTVSVQMREAGPGFSYAAAPNSL